MDDRYAQLAKDPVMDAYFSQLPAHIQAELRARKSRPATLAELQRMTDEIKRLF